MGTPASNGKLCTKLADMSIGDYIQCEYVITTEKIAGTFQNFGGVSSLTELPAAPNEYLKSGYFYFLKADKDLLIADRCVQIIGGIELNKASLLTGKLINNGLYRCLTARERIKYITNSDLNANIIKQDYNVWRSTRREITQDRTSGLIEVFSSATDTGSWWNMMEGVDNGYYYISFRPALEFIDNTKSTNIWY